MVGRITFGVLVALLVCAPECARAQVYPAHQVGGAAYGSPYQAYGPGDYSNPVPGGYGAAGQGQAVWPASAAGEPVGPGAPAPLPEGPYQNPWNYPPYSPDIPQVNDCSPWEAAYGKFRGSYFCDVAGDAIEESYFRMEYLFWTIDDPGSTLLGSPILNIKNPRETFEITAPVIGTAEVSDVHQIRFTDNSGFRGTWGIPLMFGTFEVGGFVLAQASDSFTRPELPNTDNFFIATSTLIDGEISTLQRFYDLSFEATYKTDVWGTNANVLFDPNVPGEGIQHRPLAGFRFLSVRSNLSQIGISSAQPDFRTIIESDTSNHIYGLNLGLESALVHRWFTLGVRPQVALGLNSFRNNVATERWVSSTEGRIEHELEDTAFVAVGELSLFAKIPVNENFNLHFGFNGMIISDLQLPDETIVYNTISDGNGSPVRAAFRAENEPENLKMYGFTAGAEFIFR